jgi:ligand-binding sensor domain-containing protein/serine phosphatase RsbU (regulator of sigma subunit)
MNNYFRKFLFSLFCCCVSAVSLLRAQELKFSHIGSDQGLSQAMANCIYQDRDGFMWFATQEGLNKYDGYSFKIYKNDPNDSTTISNSYQHSIIQDHNGHFWIGTNGGGADELDERTGRFKHYVHQDNNPNSISHNNVRVIFEDSDRRIWLGTENGLNLLDPATGKIKHFFKDSADAGSICSNNINTIFQDKKGRLWFGTQNGLSLYDKKTGRFSSYIMSEEEVKNKIWKNYSSRSVEAIAERSRRIRTIFEDAGGMLWIGTDGTGVLLFDPETKTYTNALITNTGEVGMRVLAITGDLSGRIWIGSYGSGIFIYNPSTGIMENHLADDRNAYALKRNDIKCILCDRDGNVWIGSFAGAVSVHFKSMNKFAHIKRTDAPAVETGSKTSPALPNSIRNEVVMAIMEDKNDRLWIGTYGGGLTTLDRKTGIYKHYPQLSTASQDAVLALLESSDGDIWVCTYGAGINRWNPETGKIRNYGTPAFMKEGTVLCIAEDKDHIIWYGTFDSGLYRLNPATDQLTRYTIAEGLTSNSIATLYFTRNGLLCIGTSGGGFMLMDPRNGKILNSFQHKKDVKSSISNNFVNSFSEDSKGDIWIATQNGLNRYSPAKNEIRTWSEHDGMINNYLYGVIVDANDKVWFSSNKGITCFDPLMNNENGAAFRNFGVNDGLQRGEFNQGAFHVSRKGEFFFGGIYGLNMFYPEKIKQTTGQPPVWITSYKQFGKEVVLDTAITYKKYIELSWKDNYISFEFAALDFAMPQKNKYQYKLEGFDDDWSPPSNNRFASYTNLPGGTYTFRVRAANSEGVWNETGTSLQIRIIPPFWKTTWFYIVCVLIAIAAVFGFIRYRTSAIQKENKILEQRVEERTSELAQKNADITASIEYAKRIQSAMLPPLDQLFRHLPEAFVLYRPKDIVSGDFYWFGEKNNRKVIVAADCTGHGVPGALMSMIGHNLLNQIVLEKGITEPGKILTALNEGVRNALKQGHHRFEGEDTSDGMDICLCSIDDSKKEVQYAGALRPLVLVKNGVLTKIDSDRYPIGGHQDNNELEYTTHTFTAAKTDTIYLFSDGYADQFGGPKGKKFMVKRMQDMLISIQGMSMQEQGTYLGKTITDWMGSMQQVDDILVIGIRF